MFMPIIALVLPVLHHSHAIIIPETERKWTNTIWNIIRIQICHHEYYRRHGKFMGKSLV